MRWTVPSIFPPDSNFPKWDFIPAGVIATWNWEKPRRPPVHHFRLAWSADHLYVRFDCLDYEIVADHGGLQNEVWRDNCVELFVSPSPDLSVEYFNFEFSCIGGALGALGSERGGRVKLREEDLAQVSIRSLHRSPLAERYPSAQPWWLEASIPFDLIECYTGVHRPRTGTIWRANLNACAERISEPYFVTWSPVRTPTPDFHQPDFLGELLFD